MPTDAKEAQHIAVVAKKGYFVLDGVLYYESNDVPGRRRLVVPEKLREYTTCAKFTEKTI